MRKWIYLLIPAMLMAGTLSAQMTINGQTRYGNEWIDYSKNYIKLIVNEDGLYRVSYQELLAQGIPAGVVGAGIQVFRNGEQVPIHLSSEGSLTNNDYLIFYGERNDGYLDRFHFQNWITEQLNPRHSMYTDNSVYYLTWGVNPQTAWRYEQLDNDLSGNLPVKRKFYMHTESQIYSDRTDVVVAFDEPEVEYSSFLATEGYGSRLQKTHNLTFPATNIYQNGPLAKMEIRTGANQSDHNVLVSVNDVPLVADPYQGAQIKFYAETLPTSALKENNTIRVESQRQSDLTKIAYANLIYPREFVARLQNTFEFSLEGNTFNNYMEISQFSAGANNYAFDIDNYRMLEAKIENDVAKVLFPQSGQFRSRVILASKDALKTVERLEPYKFESMDNLNPEYLILTSRKLNKEENGVNQVQAYADFRSSPSGGNYDVGIINVEDIVQQFGYGVEQHSHAIKNFSNYIRTKWPDFEMAFIIGKALNYGRSYDNTEFENIVPTYGKPGSDNILFAEGDKPYPYVGVGRLAAQTAEDVRVYLDKARVYARIHDLQSLTIEERLWLKNVIHLSGGDPRIQELLYSHLNNMKDTISTNKYGAEVVTFRKVSSDPVQTSLSQEIIKEINRGQSILTFFGHSSAGTFDFSVEDPKQYDNYGRWPVMLAMGCHAGDIHENTESLSEQMILEDGLGAIVFIASSGNAFISPLADMGISFYDMLGDEFYGQPISLILKELFERQYDQGGLYSSTGYVTLAQQKVYHGDPAIRLYSPESPDYVVDFSTVNTGEDVGSQDEYINLEFDLVNIGNGIGGTLNNYLIHSYGSDKKDTIYFETNAPYNRETVTVRVRNPGFEAIGKNTINIVLDYDNRVQEAPAPSAEQNNDLSVAWNNEGYCFFVFDNSAFPIYPKDFAIVYDKDATLKASATNAFADKAIYTLEIDTTENFDSPLRETKDITASPGFIEWNPDVEFVNNTVYYWRIIPKDDPDAKWNTSSFVYLEGSSDGWNQSHFYQWLYDDYTTYEMEEETRTFQYFDNVKEVKLKNAHYIHNPNDDNNPNRLTITAENDAQGYIQFAPEIRNGIFISVFDAQTGLPWLNEPSADGGYFNSYLFTSWAEHRHYFPFKTDTPEERAKAIAFIEDVIPTNSYVTILTQQSTYFGNRFDFKPEEWASDASSGRDLMSVLESHGAQMVRELSNGAVPYIFGFRKGDPSFNNLEILATSENQIIETEFNIIGKWHQGEVQSTTIGPAQTWNRLQWNLTDLDNFEDRYRLDLIGVNDDGDEEILFENVDNFDFDISSINSDRYPYLKINFYSYDSTSYSSAQLDYWRVLYEELPEAILDTEQKFIFNNDTLSLGETLTLSTIATNITGTDMDSLLVKYTIVDEENQEYVDYERLAPLRGGESLDINYEYPTADLTGLNQFIVEINPAREQTEQYYFNNIGIIDFNVTGDNINPILDVTFDGMHIMDGDIVSPTPSICVTLRDEADAISIDDVSHFNLALQALPDPQSFPVDLTASNVMFVPADSSNQVAKLIFTPELESGDYILYAQGTDGSGNLSGDQDIEVRFKVIEESMISNVLNYPNPFTSSTQFVFTITGNQVPEVFTIQIMTLSGKMVREITKEELGNLRIGVNRTDYRWDGTDEFGNKLANGIYLYRVVSSQENGQSSGQYDLEKIDRFFYKGFSKLAILR